MFFPLTLHIELAIYNLQGTTNTAYLSEAIMGFIWLMATYTGIKFGTRLLESL